MARTRKRPPEFFEFEKRLKEANAMRKRIDALVLAGHLSTREQTYFYEGLFMRIVTAFEAFVEDLFLSCLLSKHKSSRSSIKPRIKIKSSTIAKELILHTSGGRDYVDWIPFHVIESRAETFLVGGRPFTCLDDGKKGQLGHLVIIRNAIAHQSDFAVKKFKDKIIGNMILLPEYKMPGGFLRHVYRTASGETRLEFYLKELRQIAITLTD